MIVKQCDRCGNTFAPFIGALEFSICKVVKTGDLAEDGEDEVEFSKVDICQPCVTLWNNFMGIDDECQGQIGDHREVALADGGGSEAAEEAGEETSTTTGSIPT